jgi:hypothetical protein
MKSTEHTLDQIAVGLQNIEGGSMNPVFTFILGLLIGWLIEWVIDYFYWRRRDAEKARSCRCPLVCFPRKQEITTCCSRPR